PASAGGAAAVAERGEVAEVPDPESVDQRGLVAGLGLIGGDRDAVDLVRRDARVAARRHRRLERELVFAAAGIAREIGAANPGDGGLALQFPGLHAGGDAIRSAEAL